VRTPVFGNLGSTPAPLSDRQHSKLLRGALRDAQRRSPRRRSQLRDDEDDGDVEDPDRTLVDPWNHKAAKGKKPSRISWFDASGVPPTEFSRLNLESPEIRTAQGGATVEIETIPPSPAMGQVYNAVPSTSSNSNLHRYPPSQSPRASVDGVEATVKHAASVIKHAVLHDARNLRGKNGEDLGSLSWNVNSSHEAKVFHAASLLSVHLFQ
jgi:hypothetical protein